MDPLTIEDVLRKASDIFFPGGESGFAGNVLDMRLEVCDATQKEIDHFPDDGTLHKYLDANGLYPSTTYLYLRSKPWSLCEGLRSSANASTATSATFQPLQAAIKQPNNVVDLEEAASSQHTVVAPSSSSFPTNTLLICQVCSCSYEQGSFCLRCWQDEEFQKSLQADILSVPPTSPQPAAAALNLQDVRARRIEVFGATETLEKIVDSTIEAENISYGSQPTSEADNTFNGIQTSAEPIISTNEETEISQSQTNVRQLAEEPTGSATQSMSTSESNLQQRQPIKLLTVHHSRIKSDMIEHFKDPSVLTYHLIFSIIDKRGNPEQGAGDGVYREVFSYFWLEFSNSMTIGERERVPFVRHDHFISEYESIARILVVGFKTASYFPLFLSQAYLCFTLFGNQVPDEMLLQSLKRYLSPMEEELIDKVLRSDNIAESEEELDEFLERFNVYTMVTKDNVNKVILEIAKQELISKPHLMIGAWQDIVQELKSSAEFSSIGALQSFYEKLRPTVKKVLSNMTATPQNDGERDAYKYLQRFVRGLDAGKLVKFLLFTTATDVMMEDKLEVIFTRNEGLSSRPIAHTCGPVLELPSTYSNYVELREEFTNILNKENGWEMDIL
eukprot:Seg13725.1 transcript_id=Seg13725.1/GoldUCD/mRNA.D3Y31 product="hypothetical protein" protein_id=Seg13725.1/GoldUCD/D3Y31